MRSEGSEYDRRARFIGYSNLGAGEGVPALTLQYTLRCRLDRKDFHDRIGLDFEAHFKL